MMNRNALLTEQCKIVTGLGPVTPSTSTPDYVSLKGYDHLTIIVQVLNSTTVTGSAITLKQATDVGNGASDEKAVSFTSALRNVDTGATDTLASFTVSSNTFTTDTTNSKGLLYVIDVVPEMLDIAGNFDCVRLGTGNAANTTLSATYILWPAKYGKGTPVSAILD